MNKLELGQKIRALRKERKQTLETLAEAADIGLVYLGEIERGIKMPSLKTFIKLVNALDVSADELIGLETKSGRDYYTQKLSEQLQSLTQEEAAAVLSILETSSQFTSIAVRLLPFWSCQRRDWIRPTTIAIEPFVNHCATNSA